MSLSFREKQLENERELLLQQVNALQEAISDSNDKVIEAKREQIVTVNQLQVSSSATSKCSPRSYKRFQR